jgi:signal transduction histidine kinase
MPEAKLQSSVDTEDTYAANVVAVVSHELRTPLGVIVGTAELIEEELSCEGIDLDAVHQRFEVIRRTGKRMARLIGDLLDYTRLQRRSLAIELEDVSVACLVEEAAEEAAPVASIKSLEVRTLVRDCIVRCDRERVLQVLTNFIGNAMKFAPAASTITIGAMPDGMGGTRFFVRDTGPGIARRDMARVFEPFWQDARHRHCGLGLGLAISKEIIEHHHGRIWVESELGNGASFMFSLPSYGSITPIAR